MEKIIPPVAKKIPQITSIHGYTRTDDYFWLRDKQNPEVIKYLEEENAYTERMTSHTKVLQERIFGEIKSRIKEDDSDVPVKDDDYYYYSRTETGKQYSIFCRKKDSLENPEEILLDQNSLAEGKSYLRVGGIEISPDHKMMSYSVDEKGDERYRVYVKNLESSEIIDQNLVGVESLEWANDNKTFYYVLLDEKRRPYKVMKHSLGMDSSLDEKVYEESDERFFVSIRKSRSKKYIFIEIKSAITSEVRFLDADDTFSTPIVINPRENDHIYYVDHRENEFYILTNSNAKNYKLMRSPVSNCSIENWTEVIAHRDTIPLESFNIFKDFLLVNERIEGITQVRVMDFLNNTEHHIAFPEKAYEVEVNGNPNFNTHIFRLQYSSLLTPDSVFDYSALDRSMKLLKRDEVFGYEIEKYSSERIFATAEDGTQIPISLVYKKGLERNGNNPLYLYGYGSYGAIVKPYFNSYRLSLLDRGFVFAIAHIRGGEDMGRDWYENGKYLKKMNTFTDFIACAEHMIKEGYTSKDRIAVDGRSAGGLLIGASINLRPDLFKVAVAGVPFVDVVNTILDPSIPLTVIEWEEWGNPNNKEYYDYMMTYSPYDNVEAKEYPALLVTAGLNDPRVGYWEPAKWVAKLRSLKTDNNLLLLKTEMGAGHGGPSGRYNRIKEMAFEYAFVLDTLGIKE